MGKARGLPVWITLGTTCILAVCVAWQAEPRLMLWYWDSGISTQANTMLRGVLQRVPANLICLCTVDQIIPWGLAILLGLSVGAIAGTRPTLHGLLAGILAFLVYPIWYSISHPGWFTVTKPLAQVLDWSTRVFACVIVWLTSRWVYARRMRSRRRGMPVSEDSG